MVGDNHQNIKVIFKLKKMEFNIKTKKLVLVIMLFFVSSICFSYNLYDNSKWPLPDFQLGISFYNGHHAPEYKKQLKSIKSAGFNNIRVFVNRFNPNDAGFTVFDESGNLTSEIAGFKELMQEAKKLGLIVNITFWARYENTLRSDKRKNIQPYLNGIMNTTRFLGNSGFDEHDFYLDLGNEHSDPLFVGGYISEEDLKLMIFSIKSEFPKIKLTASITGWMSPTDASNYAARVGIDILSYHEHRGKGLWRWNDMEELTRELQSAFKGPVFFDEPACSDYAPITGFDNPDDKFELVTTDRLLTAYRDAKKAGAKMWVLHHHACWPPYFPGLNHKGIIPRDMYKAEKEFFKFHNNQNP